MKKYIAQEAINQYNEVKSVRCIKFVTIGFMEMFLTSYLASLIGLEWDSETGKVIR